MIIWLFEFGYWSFLGKEKKMSWKLAVVPKKKVEKFIDPLITS